jgi:hypothetical protein
LNVLRIEQQPLPVQAVSKDTTDKRKQHDGQLPQEEIQAKVKGIFGEIIDKPALCKLLYKCTNGRNARPEPHDPEITVSKRSENAIQERQGFDHQALDPVRRYDELSVDPGGRNQASIKLSAFSMRVKIQG